MTSVISLFQFDNSYARLPSRFYAEIAPDLVERPKLIAFNHELAAELGLPDGRADQLPLAELFSGSLVPEGAQPLALAYAGHQFGHFVPQLGDGRAHLLGEVVDNQGVRRDIQFKGSGQTPFSRNGDGKSALGPVVREYLLSEAMYHLGVPTTRALAAVATGEYVHRDTPEPGGVVTRVAASHVRIGTFEYFASRRDEEALKLLVDYVIDRHYPALMQADSPASALFEQVAKRQAELVAQWMSLGFIHGVMNTDNMLLSGETIDYGPCAFLDEFDFHKVFSSIDRQGRYAYGQQGRIAQWNLARLAECLMVVGGKEDDYKGVLERFVDWFEEAFMRHLQAKLGLQPSDEDDDDLITAWLQHLQDQQLDFTLSFRQLADQLSDQLPNQIPGHEKDTAEPRFGEFESRWKDRLARQSLTNEQVREKMHQVNPLYIPRNHQVERAIQAALLQDYDPMLKLAEVLREPFTERPGLADFAKPPAPDQRVYQTFCGT